MSVFGYISFALVGLFALAVLRDYWPGLYEPPVADVEEFERRYGRH